MKQFIHDPYQPGETIAAIATPPGEGGVAIIRISGDNAIDLADAVFSGKVSSYQSHTAHFGKVIDANGGPIDEALLIPMRAPRSYTGEDTVEIQCHGGGLITRKVLQRVLEAGARLAKPGEFTFKAYMNGKIDLTQAEAVQELICAKNEYALNAAENQLKGSLSEKIGSFQERLTTIAAILEAWVDFPEEGLEFASIEETCEDLREVMEEMIKLCNTFHDGKILHEGLSLCLVGAPNVGKSSLMNALLDRERAIVSHIPGTTRDIVEDHLRINGLNLKLIDTAGIRETEEVIEQEGIRRSKEALNEADLILLVLDTSRPLLAEDLKLMESVPPAKSIAVLNKIDLPHGCAAAITLPHQISVSARNREGIDQLKELIDTVIWKDGPPSKEEILITNVRHKEALSDAIESCKRVHQGFIDGLSPEFLTMDMRSCLYGLGKIIGTNVTEDILTSIFSQFCIGK